MPPNSDDTAAIGANPRDLGIGTAAFVEEDFHLIDDPPEYEGGRGELDAEDDLERRVAASAPQSADKPVSEGDETPETDPAEPGKAARFRGVAGSAAGSLRRGVTGIGKAARTVGDGIEAPQEHSEGA